MITETPHNPQEAERVVWYDPEMQRQAFLNVLDNFSTWVFTENIRSVVGKRLLDQLRTQENIVRSRLDSDFTLIVIGDFKRGKSTLINSLLGLQVVHTNIAPETVTINLIRYGPELQVEAHLTDGGRVRLALEETAADQLVPFVSQMRVMPTKDSASRTILPTEILRILTNHFNLNELSSLCFELNVDYDQIPGRILGEKARELILHARRHGFYNELVEVCLRLRPQVAMMPTQGGSISRRLPHLEQLRNKVSHLVIEAPVDWLRGVTLVDTPGMGDLLYRFDEQVQSYLPKADAVIYVISALSPLSESERAFLQFSLRPTDFAKVFFVVNMLDAINTDDDARRLMRSITTKIHTTFLDTPVFGVSALDEFSRLHNQPRPNAARGDSLTAGYTAFREAIEDSLLFNRDIIQLDRAIAKTDQMLADFESTITRIQRASEADQVRLSDAIRQWEDHNSDLHQQIAQHKQDVREGIQSLGGQAVVWIDGFFDRLDRETIPSLASVKIEDIQRHFHFFLSDAFNAAINQCLDTHRPHIVDLLDNARRSIRADVDRLTETLVVETDVAQSAAQVTFGEIAWTNLDAIHFVVDQSLIVIFSLADELLMTVAGLLIQHKKMTEPQRVMNYQRKLREALPQLRASVATEIQALYIDLSNEIQQQIEVTYQNDMESSLASLRQAQELHMAGEQHMTVANETFAEVLSLTAEARRSLKDCKGKLWPRDLVEDAPVL